MVAEHNYTRKRTFWSDEEDARLVELVDVYGIHNWPEVAGALHGRDSKSCSLRWRYFLAPHIIRSTDQKLSDWEVAVLVWAQREYGNKWRTIVDNYLPWRSPNDLKNYCNQYVNGKHNHVITENKLLLQNVPLAVLLAHPPPEVQERWMHVNSMRGAPKGQQRPPKKGTRGLSYIIRQAAKLKTQRSQPYTKPSSAAAAAPSGTAEGPAAGAAGGGSFTRSMSGPLGRPDGPPGIAGMYSTAGGAAAAAAAASTLAGLAPYGSAAGVPTVAQGLLGSGNSSNSSSFSMQYSSPQSAVQYPSSSMGPPGICGIMPNMNMNSSFSSLNMNMPAGTVQSYPPPPPPPPPAAAAAAAAAGLPTPGQRPVPQSWAPVMDSSSQGMNMNDGSASALPYTPRSATSCFTPISLKVAMNMAGGAEAVNCGVISPPGSQFAPGCGSAAAAAAAAGPVPGGAFSFQGANCTLEPLASYTCFQQQQQQMAVAAGGYAPWQEAPEFGCGNSISSTSSSSYAVDAAGVPSPTNHVGAHHYHQQQQSQQLQQQQPIGAGPCGWQHMMDMPQQLLAHSQHKHQQQHQNKQQQAVLPAASLPMPFPVQLMQQQQLKADLHARSSGTGAGALPVAAADPTAAAAGSPIDSFDSIGIMGFDASDVYDEDLEGIADLLGSDTDGEDFNVEYGVHTANVPAAAAAGKAGCFVAQQQQQKVFMAPAAAGAGTQPDTSVSAATAAAAAATAAGPVKVELQGMQHAEALRLNNTSSGGASVDLSGILSFDNGFDFQMTSDDYELLAQAAGW